MLTADCFIVSSAEEPKLHHPLKSLVLSNSHPKPPPMPHPKSPHPKHVADADPSERVPSLGKWLHRRQQGIAI